MSEKKKFALNPIIGLALRLLAITGVVALILAFVNSVTEERIYENNNAARLAAVSDVLPELYTATRDVIEVEGATLIPANNMAISYINPKVAHMYCAEVIVQGYAGEIDLMVGVVLTRNEDTYEYTVSNVKIVSHHETAGTSSHGDFIAQFADKSSDIVLGEDVDAISGATVSSKAITKGVNQAIDAVRSYVNTQIGGGDTNG